MAMPMVCLQGAYLADTFWGRYKTILVFSCIYLLVRDLMKIDKDLLLLLEISLVSHSYVECLKQMTPAC